MNLCAKNIGLDLIENNMNMDLRNLCMKEECALCQLCMQNYSQLFNIQVLELEYAIKLRILRKGETFFTFVKYVFLQI